MRQCPCVFGVERVDPTHHRRGVQMDRAEAERRDRVLREFFVGKDWDHNDEFILKRSLVLRSGELLPDCPFVIDDEWDVLPGHTNHGRGDLVFTDGEGGFAVVEVKFIDNDRSGRTARVKRTKSRGLVVDQARTYGEIVARRDGATREVIAFTYTNEDPDRVVEVGRYSLA